MRLGALDLDWQRTSGERPGEREKHRLVRFQETRPESVLGSRCSAGMPRRPAADSTHFHGVFRGSEALEEKTVDSGAPIPNMRRSAADGVLTCTLFHGCSDCLSVGIHGAVPRDGCALQADRMPGSGREARANGDEPFGAGLRRTKANRPTSRRLVWHLRKREPQGDCAPEEGAEARDRCRRSTSSSVPGAVG